MDTQFWENKLKEQGPNYVGPVNRSDEQVEKQGEIFYSHIGIHLLPCYRLLDFGCGTGRLRNYFKEHVQCYNGADIVDVSKFLGLGEYVPLRSGTIPVADNYYDAVVIATVFQHIVNDEEFKNWCKEIRRACRHKAQVHVIDDNSYSNVAHVKIRSMEHIALALEVEVEKHLTMTGDPKIIHHDYMFGRLKK